MISPFNHTVCLDKLWFFHEENSPYVRKTGSVLKVCSGIYEFIKAPVFQFSFSVSRNKENKMCDTLAAMILKMPESTFNQMYSKQKGPIPYHLNTVLFIHILYSLSDIKP